MFFFYIYIFLVLTFFYMTKSVSDIMDLQTFLTFHIPIPYLFALKIKWYTTSHGKWSMFYILPWQFEWMNEWMTEYLFHPRFFFFWPLCCLFFFPLVSSNSSSLSLSLRTFCITWSSTLFLKGRWVFSYLILFILTLYFQ